MITRDRIAGMNSNQLLLEYDNQSDLLEVYERNAEDTQGATQAVWLHEASCVNLGLRLMSEEIKRRKANDTLYDGNRGILKGIYEWAGTIAKDERHRYNIVRKVAMKRHGIYMLEYKNRIF